MTATLQMTFVIALATSLLFSCSAPQNLGLEAGALIRRNLFHGNDTFPIEDPFAFQYGSVHVDGPTGGMLYRFVASPEAFEWLVAEWSLGRTVLESVLDLPFGFLEDTPTWWRPETTDAAAYYGSFEEFGSGGRREVFLVFDPVPSVLHVIEHFSNMRGA